VRSRLYSGVLPVVSLPSTCVGSRDIPFRDEVCLRMQRKNSLSIQNTSRDAWQKQQRQIVQRVAAQRKIQPNFHLLLPVGRLGLFEPDNPALHLVRANTLHSAPMDLNSRIEAAKAEVRGENQKVITGWFLYGCC
jgi:hypothetical protein